MCPDSELTRIGDLFAFNDSNCKYPLPMKEKGGDRL